MDDMLFLFDLDSTITRAEILPTIAERFSCGGEMRELTEAAMSSALPFRESFLRRVELLKNVPVSEVCRTISEIPLNELLVDFMRRNASRCFIVTGNLDVWIEGLVERIGLTGNVFSSRALARGDRLASVVSVMDKGLVVDQLNGRFVAVGDGSNDAEMVSRADVGIAYGGVRNIAPVLLDVCDYAIYDEEKLCQLIKRL